MTASLRESLQKVPKWVKVLGLCLSFVLTVIVIICVSASNKATEIEKAIKVSKLLTLFLNTDCKSIYSKVHKNESKVLHNA